MKSLNAQNAYTLQLALHALCRQFIRQQETSPLQMFESTCLVSSCVHTHLSNVHFAKIQKPGHAGMGSPHIQIPDSSGNHCIWQTPGCGSALSRCSSPAAVWRKVLQAHKIESRLAFGPFLCSKKNGGVDENQVSSFAKYEGFGATVCHRHLINCCAGVSAMQTAGEMLAIAKACRPIAQLMETRQARLRKIHLDQKSRSPTENPNLSKLFWSYFSIYGQIVK